MSDPQLDFRSKKKRTWQTWSLFVGTALLTVLAIEIGLRLVATAADKVRGATFDSELGWRLVPNITKMDAQWSGKVPATTNSAGWRDAEFSLEKAAGIIRILVLGDSFTFGFGVDYGQRFSEYLEKMCPSVEVLNMGVFAYDIDQELRVYELYGNRYRPDIVMLNVYLGNDVEGLRLKKVYGFPKPYFVPANDQLVLVKPEQSWSIYVRTHSYLAELVFRALERGSAASAVANELQHVDMDTVFFSLIAKLDAATTIDHAKLLLVLHHPRDATTDKRARNQYLGRELIAKGYNVLDLYGVFTDHKKPDVDLYLADGHLSSAGHLVVAEAMRKYLIARKWISP